MINKTRGSWATSLTRPTIAILNTDLLSHNKYLDNVEEKSCIKKSSILLLNIPPLLNKMISKPYHILSIAFRKKLVKISVKLHQILNAQKLSRV